MTDRRPGPSVRLRLALSYAGVVVVTAALLLTVVWLFLLRYVPVGNLTTTGGHVPDRTDLVRAFVPPAVWAFLVLVVLGVVGGWLLAGRVLDPLRRLTEASRAVSSGALDHRVDLPGRRDEFRELADAFDGMVARLAADVAEQQRFAANASHELRTPLATTRALLEVAVREPGNDPAAVLDRLRVVNERAIDLTESLLVLARAGRRVPDPEPVDLSLLVEDAVETLLPLAEARGVALDADEDADADADDDRDTDTAAHVHTDAAWTTGSPALLLQLVTNLVQNAVVHNVGPGGWVRIRTGGSSADGGAGTVVLLVENTGPRVPRAVLPTLTEPFQRAASRRRDEDTGAGLGLAIVAAIVAAHGGALTVDARDGGGLSVRVALPSASPPVRPRQP
ncbi:HAMP domain-containing sensor histidine kinase [Curtobacterium sp. UCD-KPL2560]|uniref:sensor histidine kinase n=1 Tax=Curtobacterium sp. UCD-KPL2560 TaxID=1885315 RepID=UPI0008264408|nr:HAMP domain-containing sensor histidine kinase [Curtobacterium sp. UCD-KPL2560]